MISDNVINLLAQNRESQAANNALDIKELKETWYTKSELKKINNESSPQRASELKKIEAELQQQYNLTRVKIEEQEVAESDAFKQNGRVEKRRKPINNRQKK